MVERQKKNHIGAPSLMVFHLGKESFIYMYRTLIKYILPHLSKKKKSPAFFFMLMNKRNHTKEQKHFKA